MDNMLCYVDLDGVIVNWMGGFAKLHGCSLEEAYRRYNDRYKVDKNEFWAPLNHEFWANLEWMPDGREILDHVINVFGQKNVFIASSPSINPYGASGKVEWIQRELPNMDRQFMLGKPKYLLAHGFAVLIDDDEENIELFGKSGGRTVLVPRPWNVGGRYWTSDSTLALIKMRLVQIQQDLYPIHKILSGFYNNNDK